MKNRVSVTEAARNFSEIVNRVRYRGEEFIVERRHQPVCRIVPVGPLHATLAGLAELLRTIPKPDAGYFRAVEQAIRKQPRMPKSPWPS